MIINAFVDQDGRERIVTFALTHVSRINVKIMVFVLLMALVILVIVACAPMVGLDGIVRRELRARHIHVMVMEDVDPKLMEVLNVNVMMDIMGNIVNLEKVKNSFLLRINQNLTKGLLS